MPELDAVRGLAILMVVVYHGLYWRLDLSHFAPLLRGILAIAWIGRLGVNLFFVLSGFLITGLLVNSKHKRDYFSNFYIRRALRILPAYLVAIGILIAISYTSWPFIVLSLAYLSNLTPIFGVPIGYPVLWSLAVEEHFYLFWPLVVRKLNIATLAKASFAIVLISPILRLLSFYSSLRNGASSFVCNEYTWNSIDGLACGALLAIWLRSNQPSRNQVKRLALLLLAVGLVVEMVGLPFGIWTRQQIVGAALQVFPWHLAFVALLCLFLLAGTSSSLLKKAVQWKLLTFMGRISYGLYLYHLLAFDFVDYLSRHGIWSNWLGTERIGPLMARLLSASILAITAAYLSRSFIEDYFLSMKEKLAPS